MNKLIFSIRVQEFAVVSFFFVRVSVIFWGTTLCLQGF